MCPRIAQSITKSLLTLGERGQAGQRGDRHTAGNVAVHSAIVTVTWNKQTLESVSVNCLQIGKHNLKTKESESFNVPCTLIAQDKNMDHFETNFLLVGYYIVIIMCTVDCAHSRTL